MSTISDFTHRQKVVREQILAAASRLPELMTMENHFGIAPFSMDKLN